MYVYQRLIKIIIIQNPLVNKYIEAFSALYSCLVNRIIPFI